MWNSGGIAGGTSTSTSYDGVWRSGLDGEKSWVYMWYSNGLNSVNELNLKGHDTKMVGEKEL